MALEDEIINIEDLEIATEVKIGDYVLLETTDGTRLLDFKDFIIGVDNVTFFDKISGTYLKTSDISAISAKAEANHTILTTLSAVTADIDNNKLRINDAFSSLATFVDSISTSTINASDISSNTNSKVGFTVSNTVRKSLNNTKGALLFDRLDFKGTGLVEGTDIQVGDGSTNNSINSFFYKAKDDYGMLFNGMIGVRVPRSAGADQRFLTIHKQGVFYARQPLQMFSNAPTNSFGSNTFSHGTYNFSVYMNLKKGEKVTLHLTKSSGIEASTFSGIRIM